MKAIILAAGRGERMHPLTRDTPKPLLRAGGKWLIEYHLLALAKAEVHDVVINLGYLGEQIEAALGDGARHGVRIQYSREGDEILNTGGGIFHALPWLGADPFLVVNGDIYTDFPYARLPVQPSGLAHLVLVDNPSHHPCGDFALDPRGWVRAAGASKYTYAGVGVYRRELFEDCMPGVFPLAPLLRHAIVRGLVSGEYYGGVWYDIGTPERLQALDHSLI